MQKTDFLKELNGLSMDELNQKIAEREEELSNLRIQSATQQLSSPIRMRQLRREIARIHTVKTAMAAQQGEDSNE